MSDMNITFDEASFLKEVLDRMVRTYSVFEKYDHINREIFLSSLAARDVNLSDEEMNKMIEDLENGVMKAQDLLQKINETFGI